MTGIYIGSTSPRAGKSLLVFALGLLLRQRAYSIGYMKPVGRSPIKSDELLGDADALVAQEVLGQNAPADQLSPVMIPDNLHALALREEQDPDEPMRSIRKGYEKISAGMDITLVSGTGAFPFAGRFAQADGFAILRALELKALLVERFTGQINYDALLLFKDVLGPALMGVVLNDVPDNEMRNVEQVLCPWLESKGIPVLGVLGHEQGLAAMRISELAQGLKGRIVTGSGQNAKMVHGFLIGTMQVDNFMMHLRQSPGSAVIVGGDRADLQLAALHAQSPCIILTGNISPSELIRTRAESMGVTLVAVREDTYTVARSMARILKSKKARDLHQVRLAVSLVEKALQFRPMLDRILHALHLPPHKQPL